MHLEKASAGEYDVLEIYLLKMFRMIRTKVSFKASILKKNRVSILYIYSNKILIQNFNIF